MCFVMLCFPSPKCLCHQERNCFRFAIPAEAIGDQKLGGLVDLCIGGLVVWWVGGLVVRWVYGLVFWEVSGFTNMGKYYEICITMSKIHIKFWIHFELQK